MPVADRTGSTLETESTTTGVPARTLGSKVTEKASSTCDEVPLGTNLDDG